MMECRSCECVRLVFHNSSERHSFFYRCLNKHSLDHGWGRGRAGVRVRVRVGRAHGAARARTDNYAHKKNIASMYIKGIPPDLLGGKAIIKLAR